MQTAFILTMIFIAGISPKIKVLDQNPRRCPVCGLHQAYNKRVDHYLSLFFIPVLRVKKGEPFVMCDRCQGSGTGFETTEGRPSQDFEKICRHCSKRLNRDYKYCPYCGKLVD